MTREMLVVTPLHRAVKLTDVGNKYHALVTHPPELNCEEKGFNRVVEYGRENDWLRSEGFLDLITGRIVLEPNPELEELCKMIEKA